MNTLYLVKSMPQRLKDLKRDLTEAKFIPHQYEGQTYSFSERKRMYSTISILIIWIFEWLHTKIQVERLESYFGTIESTVGAPVTLQNSTKS